MSGNGKHRLAIGELQFDEWFKRANRWCRQLLGRCGGMARESVEARCTMKHRVRAAIVATLLGRILGMSPVALAQTSELVATRLERPPTPME
jgi:hypothetical protein